MRALILLCLPIAFNACSHAPKKAPEPVKVVVESCLPSEPPLWDTTVRVVVRGHGCPEPFSICMVAEDVTKLTKNIEDVRAYALEAWTRCAAEPALRAAPPKDVSVQR
jgi:hypothetical protein